MKIDKKAKNRASYYRTRLAEGKPLKAEHAAFLAEYDREVHGQTAAQLDAAAAEEQPDAAPGVDSPDTGATEGADDVAAQAEPDGAAAPPPPATPPPPPAPPRLQLVPPTAPPPPPRVTPTKPGGAGPKWQDAYRTGALAGGGEGREGACVWIAARWHGALQQMSKAMIEAGIEPMFDTSAEAVGGTLVLACDAILPPDIKLTPELIAGLVTTSTMAQRLIHNKKIVDARALKATQVRAAAVYAERPAPPPTPPPPAVPVETVDDGQRFQEAAKPSPTPPPPPTDARSPFAGQPLS